MQSSPVASSARDQARSSVLDPLEVKGALITLFRSPDYEPPVLPAVATELLALSRKPDAWSESIPELMGARSDAGGPRAAHRAERRPLHWKRSLAVEESDDSASFGNTLIRSRAAVVQSYETAGINCGDKPWHPAYLGGS